ncbi:MAG: cyclase family protein [Flavobacteriales bacterium]|nr:cyclase family protein [Flavobacteriales bacterium]
MSNWCFLSYELRPDLSNYGGAEGVEISSIRSIKKGDSSNNSMLYLPSHTGTHIDYPYHFIDSGKTGSSYDPDDFVFDHVAIIDLSDLEPDDYLIRPEHLSTHNQNQNSDATLLLIKTGFCYKRDKEVYWKYNWGFAPESASHLKALFPSLRAIGFDLISLSSYQQREVGRKAHRAFLGTEQMLIVEDMDLKELSVHHKPEQVIISPLRFLSADGAPVTVWARFINV